MVLRNYDRANDDILPALACFIGSDSQAINKLDLPFFQIRMPVDIACTAGFIPTGILSIILTPNE